MRIGAIVAAVLLTLLSIPSVYAGDADWRSFIVGEKYVNKRSNLKKYSFQGMILGTNINEVISKIQDKYNDSFTPVSRVIIVPEFKLGDNIFRARLAGSSLETHPLLQFCFEKDYDQYVDPREVKNDARVLEALFQRKYGKPDFLRSEPINIYEVGANSTLYSKRYDGADIEAIVILNIAEGNLRLSGCVESRSLLYHEAELYNELTHKLRAAQKEKREAERQLRDAEKHSGVPGGEDSF